MKTKKCAIIYTGGKKMMKKSELKIGRKKKCKTKKA